MIGPGIKTGLNIRIDNPATLGADMVAGCVAALEKYPCPAIIFDLGTATTVSVIDSDRVMIGGCIMPGVRISLEALSTRTAQLPHISLEAPAHVIGKNTVDCMVAGSVIGTAAMMDGICDRIEEELGKPCTVVATGGLAKVTSPYCKRKVFLDENLLLDGLYILYERNKNS
jgi:type III pantothenate kinase